MNYKKLNWGNKKEVNVVIEIPKGSSNKYEYDKETETFKLDRTMHSAVFYPFDYGFIPNTLAEDGDNLDIIVLIEKPTFTGCVIKARVIGVLEMEDEKGMDYKIISVPIETIEPRKAEINDINDLPEHEKKEIRNFMEHYKTLEPHKWAKIKGFQSKEKAMEIILKIINKEWKKCMNW